MTYSIKAQGTNGSCIIQQIRIEAKVKIDDEKCKMPLAKLQHIAGLYNCSALGAALYFGNALLSVRAAN